MNNIPLMRPDIREEDINLVAEVLRSGMLVQGVWVEKLEQEIAKYVGVDYAIAVSSGTASLHLALIALGIGPGDEVIVPAFSFVATANVVELVGAKPVFVDIDLKTFNIEVARIIPAITKQTKAIMPVHEFGLACDIESIRQIADEYGLYVIEDAACALGATDNGRQVGSIGHIGSFSFHPRKAITSGEGGIVTTNDLEIAEKIRSLRNHGISYDNGRQVFGIVGFNYRMTDIQAALLCSQFSRYEEILRRKSVIADYYTERLRDLNTVQCPITPMNKGHSWQSYHILISHGRDLVMSKLSSAGIGTNYGAQCIPGLEYYRRRYRFSASRAFPHAYVAYTNGLVLPLYSQLSKLCSEKTANEIRSALYE